MGEYNLKIIQPRIDGLPSEWRTICNRAQKEVCRGARDTKTFYSDCMESVDTFRVCIFDFIRDLNSLFGVELSFDRN